MYIVPLCCCPDILLRLYLMQARRILVFCACEFPYLCRARHNVEIFVTWLHPQENLYFSYGTWANGSGVYVSFPAGVPSYRRWLCVG